MIAVDPTAAGEIPPGDRRVGRIPVRNLWLLMLYASDLYRAHGFGDVALEGPDDDLPDLVAEILVRAVERRLHRNLSRGFQEQQAFLRRVRGRIDVLETERRQLLARGQVACRFEELSVDTPRNRYVLAALNAVARLVVRRDLGLRCRQLAGILVRMGVSGVAPTRAEMDGDRFGFRDAGDRLVVAAARLALDLALPTEDAGFHSLPAPDREIAWVRQLFEKAVAGFYGVVLEHPAWRVEAGLRIHWPIDERTDGIGAILPGMRTDVVLEHAVSGRRIVIDTKFNEILTSGWHREEALRSGYLYQMYAYLRSQEREGDPLSWGAAGILLHPAVGKSVDETVVIQGHPIRFATVDLAAPAGEIRRALLRMKDVPFQAGRE